MMQWVHEMSEIEEAHKQKRKTQTTETRLVELFLIFSNKLRCN